jgi:hypothetical protein
VGKSLLCHLDPRMGTGRHSFKHSDAARLIRAVEAAGKKITGVTLNNGVVTALVDCEQPAATGSNNANPWDEVLQNDSDKERPS